MAEVIQEGFEATIWICEYICAEKHYKGHFQLMNRLYKCICQYVIWRVCFPMEIRHK